MKYLLISLLSLIVVFESCDDSVYTRPKPTVSGSKYELDTNSQFYNTRVEIYSYQGCEYIVVGVGKSKWGSHKGNCNNPIHK